MTLDQFERQILAIEPSQRLNLACALLLSFADPRESSFLSRLLARWIAFQIGVLHRAGDARPHRARHLYPARLGAAWIKA